MKSQEMDSPRKMDSGLYKTKTAQKITPPPTKIKRQVPFLAIFFNVLELFLLRNRHGIIELTSGQNHLAFLAVYLLDIVLL